MRERPVDHGTIGGYKKGCRCLPCLQAKTRASVEQKANRVARAAVDPSVIPHGTPSGYRNWSCRCQPCTAAGSAATMRSFAKTKYPR